MKTATLVLLIIATLIAATFTGNGILYLFKQMGANFISVKDVLAVYFFPLIFYTYLSYIIFLHIYYDPER